MRFVCKNPVCGILGAEGGPFPPIPAHQRVPLLGARHAPARTRPRAEKTRSWFPPAAPSAHKGLPLPSKESGLHERLSTVRGPISHAIMGAQEDTQAGSADPARAPESYGTAAKDVAGPRAPAVTCVAAAVRCFAPFSFMLLASVLCSRRNGHLRAYASTCRCARPRAPRPSPSRADD